MTEVSREQALRALQRKAHEKAAELLASPDCVEALRYSPPPDDSRALALMVQLWRHRQSLWEDAQRFYDQWACREDELEVVVPEYDVPLPESFSSMRFMGIRLVLGAVDDRYRVRRMEVVS